MGARYWIAQHVADVMRNEPRNVGVIVSAHGQVMARFYGEDEDQQVDGRRIKRLPYPNVYRQWVSYWRKGLGDVEALKSASKGHYRLAEGGEVTDTAPASISEVSDYLYSVLVSEGGIAEALQDREEAERPGIQLEVEVEQLLRDVVAVAGADMLIPHPVERHATVRGKNLSHRPAFSQRNGRIRVMETVDLTTVRKTPSRDHAGAVAYMFRDIRDEIHEQLEALTVVRVTDEDRLNEDVDYALSAIKNESDIVEWFDAVQQNRFLAQVRATARQ
jgi:hypothetical protein